MPFGGPDKVKQEPGPVEASAPPSLISSAQASELNVYNTPFGKIRAPSDEAASKYVLNEKRRRTPFENDAGQMVYPEGSRAPAAAPPGPSHADDARALRQRYGPVLGAGAAIKADIGEFVANSIKSVLGGAAQGGRDLSGEGARVGGVASPETTGAVMALGASPMRFGASPGVRSAINTGFQPQAGVVSRGPVLGGPPTTLPGIEARIGERFAQGVGLPTKGVNAHPDLARVQSNAVDVVKDIVGNKNDLRLTLPSGDEVTGRLPSSRVQFAEAMDQRKGKIFDAFNQMAKDADASAVDPYATPINKHREAFHEAQLGEARTRQELVQANNTLTQALARQSQAGNVYATSGANAAVKQAQAGLKKAQAAFERAQQRVQSARDTAARPWVDLKPISEELAKVANDRVTRNNSEAVANYAGEKARTYATEEAYSAQEAQRAIKQFNSSLKAFYDNPSYDTAARASVDAMIANKLREGLDRMVSQATGPGYQQLKNLYGAYSALEKQVTRAAARGMSKPESEFLNRIFNVTSGEQLLEGVLSMNPAAIGRGLLLRVAKHMESSRSSPDRMIQKMFEDADKGLGPNSFANSAMRFVESKEKPKLPAMPKVGQTGPAGGTITGVYPGDRP